MKLFGSGAVLLASVLIGLLWLRERRHRLNTLRALAEALRLMEGELSLRKTALPELLRWLGGQSRGSVSLFFRCLNASVPRLGEKSFALLWEEAAVLCFPELSRLDLDELSQVGRTLGRFTLPEQLAGMESCRLRLEARLEAEETRYRDEKKLVLCLPTAAGCLLIVLLL